MGDFLRLSRWSRGLGRQAQAEALIDKPTEVYGQCPREKFLARFVAHCESCEQDVENAVLVIRVCRCSFLRERKTLLPHFVFFP